MPKIKKVEDGHLCACALPDLLPFEEVATYLGVSDRTLRRWAQKRKIVPTRLGRFVYFTADDVAACVKAGRQDVKAQ